MASTRSSSRRARQLPWDSLLLIFQLSDVPTLAVLGRVSLDFLVATSPLLYGDVEITSLEQLVKLFCKRNKPKMKSQINSHLSLADLRTLLLDFTSDPAFQEEELDEDQTEEYDFPHRPPRLDFSRLSLSSPLPIESVQLVYRHSGCESLLRFLASTVLPHLNPVRCEHRRIGKSSAGDEDEMWTCVLEAPPLDGWTRIETMRFEGTIVYLWAGGDGAADDKSCLLGLLSRAGSAQLERLELGLDSFAGLLKGREKGKEVLRLLEELDKAKSSFGVGELKDGAVVLEVRLEKGKDATEKLVSKLVRTREKYRVEMVE